MQKEYKERNHMEHRNLSIEEKIRRLEGRIQEMGLTLIAFSGGVDSSFLLSVAANVWQSSTVALMTVSSSTPPDDERQADELARRLKIQLVKVQHNELAIPQYAANPTNRCYFCKDSLYAICRKEAQQRGISTIADGVNVDDLKDFRPGLQAANEYGIVHPLVEMGFTKSDIRLGSKQFNLPTWNRPASPCLSSRVPYGKTITESMLSQIARGEAFLKSLGFRESRLRHHGKTARIEIAANELTSFAVEALSARVGKAFQDLGFTFVGLDIRGYKSGVFNEQIS
jgi:pyridinium-3,5-biscarboxylic acid mononucleotide sulfurtransferase